MENDEIINHKEELDQAIGSARTQTPVGSPCIDVCRLNPDSGRCEGCLRNREEIKAWKAMSDPDRLALLDLLAERNGAGNAQP
ncbi:DUF1289 domain-containing protein [Trinickia dinghuensis]|uniref:DUF1289 domain-containing protein n=1 Tax=Trinickia dinghuensis TaxID=2291023 RepID=A0A3D8JUZ0_9BURK|nr:DUF1289 domain-containing protein [Trinickia dinghuensis]RDU96877.1 DUF1289 domain-containing protein [Trinickia dinghuensis]